MSEKVISGDEHLEQCSDLVAIAARKERDEALKSGDLWVIAAHNAERGRDDARAELTAFISDLSRSCPPWEYPGAKVKLAAERVMNIVLRLEKERDEARAEADDTTKRLLLAELDRDEARSLLIDMTHHCEEACEEVKRLRAEARFYKCLSEEIDMKLKRAEAVCQAAGLLPVDESKD